MSASAQDSPALPLPAYAELHCLSNYSFLRGASHPAELVQRARALGYTALAITDECSFAGSVRAHLAAQALDPPLPLIHGTELHLACGMTLVLLAQNRAGYGNLCALISLGRRRSSKGSYRLTRADLAGWDHGGVPDCLALLIVPRAQAAPPRSTVTFGGTAPPAAEAAPAASAAHEQARWLAEHFAGRAWIAHERHLAPDDAAQLAALRALAQDSGLPLLAAGDVHMHVRARRGVQDVLCALRLNRTVAQAAAALFPNGERHLRSRLALARLYPDDLLAQTRVVAARCTFSLAELRYEYPEEVVPAGHSAQSYLIACTEAGLARRYPHGIPAAVRAQVAHEYALIGDLDYAPYFLTVHEIVSWARAQGILCQGRGSAANSAVCYALGITEVDPARASMLFERFVSKERNEPPDIDVDFEHERREEVIQHIYAKYGRERAALAASVICYRMRGALRDAGRALGFPTAQIDALAGNMGWWHAVAEPAVNSDAAADSDAAAAQRAAEKRAALAQRCAEVGLDASAPHVARWLDVARALVGMPRHLSQHVGGFVIARGRLDRLVPVENAAMPERTVIQWDKDDIDALGLMKVDVLALGMLSAIRRMLDAISRRNGRRFTLGDIPAEDPSTYRLMARADTVGVFQIESRAQMAMLPRLRPRTFYDLVIEVAIVRPGPIQGNMVHPYLRRREGIEPVDYPSAAVRRVLERTLGVPIFQEQAMQLAIVAAGFSPGEADGLRRAMAAWKRKGGLGPWRERLLKGMAARGYTEDFAHNLYRQIEGFGDYGFPESHAASFALLAYASAWIKCHHPAAFFAALLNAQPMGFYSPDQLLQDARRHHVPLRGVDVSHSDWDCTLDTAPPLPGGWPTPSRRAAPSDGPSPGAATGGEPPSPPSPGRGPGGWPTPSRRAAPSDGPSPPSSGRGPGGWSTSHMLTLGLRQIDGLRQASAQRIVAARSQAAFRDLADLAARAALDRTDLQTLAAAGALASLAGHRRQAAWDAAALPLQRDLFFALPAPAATVTLPAPREGEAIAADYRSLHLTLGRHPLALLRARLASRRYLAASELAQQGDRALVRVAGLVTCRQRPGTSGGVTFVTLEDETGNSNVVVFKDLAEGQRRVLLASRLLGVAGQLQVQGTGEHRIVHLIAKRLFDHSDLLGELRVSSHDFH